MTDFRDPTLEITADFGSGSTTGRFEFPVGSEGETSVRMVGRTGYLVEGMGSQIFSILSDVLGDTGESGRKGFALDLGGGQFAIELETELAADSVRSDGTTTPQWGASADTNTLNETTATGAPGLVQQQVFMNYWRHGSTDSLTPATLTVGEFRPDGMLEPLNVALEEPSVGVINNRPGIADISVTCIETATLDDVYDAGDQTEA